MTDTGHPGRGAAAPGPPGPRPSLGTSPAAISFAAAISRPPAVPPSRRGACPSLARPMPTGDGLLARLTPAGGLSPRQLAGIAAAAARCGNGTIEVTARGSLQVRGLDAASAVTFAAEVEGLGIVAAAGVPVAASPLAGLDPTAVADPRRLVARLEAVLAAAGLAGRLSPKVSVVVEAGGRVRLDDVAADVRLAATGGGRWRLGLGGDAASAAWGGTFDEAGAVDATVAVLEHVAASGREARVRTVMAAAKGIAAAVGIGAATEIAEAKGNAAGEVPKEDRGATSGAEAGDDAVDHTERDARLSHLPVPWLGHFPLADGRPAIGLALPFGFTTAADLAAVAAAAEGAGEVRLAPGHGLIVLAAAVRDAPVPAPDTKVPVADAAPDTATPAPDAVPAANVLARVAAAAEARGFVVAAGDARLAISACPGAPGCASGRIPARALAPAVAAAAAALVAAGGSVHVSGCSKGCARPRAADLTIVGVDGGCGLVHHGTADATPRERTGPAGLLAAVVRHAAEIAAGRAASADAAAPTDAAAGPAAARPIRETRA